MELSSLKAFFLDADALWASEHSWEKTMPMTTNTMSILIETLNTVVFHNIHIKSSLYSFHFHFDVINKLYLLEFKTGQVFVRIILI